MRFIKLTLSALAVTWSLVGCTSADSNEEDTVVGDSTDRIVEHAAEVLDLPGDSIDISTAFSAAPPVACSFHEAIPTDRIEPFPLQIAELADGTLIDDRTQNRGDGPSAAQAVLRACISDTGATPTTDLIANAVVRFDRTPGPLIVADPARAAGRATESGIDYREPTIESTDAGTEAVFFARNAEFGEYLQVTASLDPEGNLTVDYLD